MRLVHVSDLHFGHHDEALGAGLAADLTSQTPDLVVASGDFTQRGTVDEFRMARSFLDTLHMPVFAVPGNHDVPAKNLPLRLLNPYHRYRRFIGPELEPFVEIGGVAIAGLRTSRRLRAELNWSHGTISRSQLDELAKTFANASPGATKVVVAHHPLMQPEANTEKPTRAVKRAAEALEAFAAIGVRLVLSGHFHLSFVRRFEAGIREGVPPGPREAATAPILVAQASSTISTRLRGEPNAYNVVDIVDGEITIHVREWTGAGWHTRERASAPS